MNNEDSHVIKRKVFIKRKGNTVDFYNINC